MDQFTDDEKALLSPFFSNMDRQIFALTNLPQVVCGALFSRYSRSSKSLRRLLLDEFIKDEKSGFSEIVSFAQGSGHDSIVEFYDRVLVGYGDDSVAELGGAHIACEGVSNIASKVLEDSRIGISPLEKSTRYVYFDEKINGKYQYYNEKDIMNSRHADIYIETCDSLFDSYAKLIGPTRKWLTQKYPKGEESERAYNSTIRAKACDILRGFLPASTITNVGLYGNGRSFEYLITKMYASELEEVRSIAAGMHEELMKVIPSFVKRAKGKYGDPTIRFISETRKGMEGICQKEFGGIKPLAGKEVVLTGYDRDAEEKIVAASLYPFTTISMGQVREIVQKMDSGEKGRIIDEYLSRRENRRHRPMRGFEHAYYEFDLLANYAAYRDLHRHRMLTQQRQLLSANLGFDIPAELGEIGIEREFSEKMNMAQGTYQSIAKDMKAQAQYAVPFAYKIRWSAYLNARELYHLVELRSTIQGHRDYRKVALRMLDEVRKVHPTIVKHMKFADYREFEGLERLEAEKRIDSRIEEMKRKYGDK